MRAFLRGLYRVLQVVITCLMGLLIVPVSMQILSRYTGIIPRYIWTEEVARFCFMWIIMLGAMIAVRDDTHFDVDILPQPKTPQSQAFSRLVVHFFMLFAALIFVRYGYDFAKFGYVQHSEITGINMLSIHIAYPLAGFIWIVFLGEKVYDDINIMRGKGEANHVAR
ncbi:TRAP transporter small permease subunit [candidate division KSB3 bacterium]|uniref:TRAP transporter small permease subunit n=1 Tax=candidate division KSB3 bacterium TaxID=2044937 RepID=A0A9D5JXT3_9BACT|nr:TRAP transporter small permease subunit [candidate division KSB3 bacterium]MBD3326095.1 TRAP transporter small permease subunit [candidate division KSB3 bacterium]